MKFLLRLEDGVGAGAKHAAREAGKSLNQWIADCVAHMVETEMRVKAFEQTLEGATAGGNSVSQGERGDLLHAAMQTSYELGKERDAKPSRARVKAEAEARREPPVEPALPGSEAGTTPGYYRPYAQRGGLAGRVESPVPMGGQNASAVPPQQFTVPTEGGDADDVHVQHNRRLLPATRNYHVAAGGRASGRKTRGGTEASGLCAKCRKFCVGPTCLCWCHKRVKE